jgi:hypothetical protein
VLGSEVGDGLQFDGVGLSAEVFGVPQPVHRRLRGARNSYAHVYDYR